MKKLKAAFFKLGVDSILSKEEMKNVLGGSRETPTAVCGQLCHTASECVDPTCQKCVFVSDFIRICAS